MSLSMSQILKDLANSRHKSACTTRATEREKIKQASEFARQRAITKDAFATTHKAAFLKSFVEILKERPGTKIFRFHINWGNLPADPHRPHDHLSFFRTTPFLDHEEDMRALQAIVWDWIALEALVTLEKHFQREDRVRNMFDGFDTIGPYHYYTINIELT